MSSLAHLSSLIRPSTNAVRASATRQHVRCLNVHQLAYPEPAAQSKLPGLITPDERQVTVHTPAGKHVQGKSRHQQSVSAAYYRGGTSRAILFERNALGTYDDESLSPLFRGAIGSPDSEFGRQLDGMGGGISSLSKVGVVGRSSRETCDVDFTFAAVGIRDGDVDFSASCGNLMAAIGPFAVEQGIIALPKPHDSQHVKLITARIHNTNTNKMVDSTFQVTWCPLQELWEASAFGDFAIDGVAGTASPIRLDFLDPAGSKTGKLFPTGNTVDELVPGIYATCLDVGNPAVFVRASDLDVPGSITPAEIDQHPVLLERLEQIRRAAGLRMGIAKSFEEVPGSVPKISILAPSASCVLTGGKEQHRSEIDLLCRTLSVGQPHKAVPITTALAIAAAAKKEGTIAHEVLSDASRGRSGGRITIGHAGGKIDVDAEYEADGTLTSVAVLRSARRLFEGRVFYR